MRPTAVLSGLALVLLVAACTSDPLPASLAAAEGLPEGARWLDDDPACTPPRCFEWDIPVPEGVTITDHRVRVLLPADYATSARRYPLLYLLHDAPGDLTSWTRLGRAQSALSAVDVIAVMPDGGGGRPGWYANWQSGEYQWETYHLDVMMPFVEARLRVLGDGHRAIAGPSMGGHGALYYAAVRPGRFEAAAAISGAVDFLVVDRISALLGATLGMPPMAVWGDPIRHYPVWRDHNPGQLVEGLAGMTVLLTSGNGLPGGPHEQVGSPELYAIEPLLYIMNLSLAATLARAGVEHETFFYGPGFHDWPYYRDAFAWALPRLMARITDRE